MKNEFSNSGDLIYIYIYFKKILNIPSRNRVTYKKKKKILHKGTPREKINYPFTCNYSKIQGLRCYIYLILEASPSSFCRDQTLHTCKGVNRTQSIYFVHLQLNKSLCKFSLPPQQKTFSKSTGNC